MSILVLQSSDNMHDTLIPSTKTSFWEYKCAHHDNSISTLILYLFQPPAKSLPLNASNANLGRRTLPNLSEPTVATYRNDIQYTRPSTSIWHRLVSAFP